MSSAPTMGRPTLGPTTLAAATSSRSAPRWSVTWGCRWPAPAGPACRSSWARRAPREVNPAIEGLVVLGEPAMSLFAYTSTTLDIYAIATGMEDREWMVSKDAHPFKAIHFMQSLGHELGARPRGRTHLERS